MIWNVQPTIVTAAGDACRAPIRELAEHACRLERIERTRVKLGQDGLCHVVEDRGHQPDDKTHPDGPDDPRLDARSTKHINRSDRHGGNEPYDGEQGTQRQTADDMKDQRDTVRKRGQAHHDQPGRNAGSAPFVQVPPHDPGCQRRRNHGRAAPASNAVTDHQILMPGVKGDLCYPTVSSAHH